MFFVTVAGAASILRNFRQTETELGHCYRFPSARETSETDQISTSTMLSV